MLLTFRDRALLFWQWGGPRPVRRMSADLRLSVECQEPFLIREKSRPEHRNGGSLWKMGARWGGPRSPRFEHKTLATLRPASSLSGPQDKRLSDRTAWTPDAQPWTQPGQ